MSKQIDDGYVFPYRDQGKRGMSLRDHFAAAALNGMLASDSSVDRTKVKKDAWAKAAYDFADAMLKAREVL